MVEYWAKRDEYFEKIFSVFETPYSIIVRIRFAVISSHPLSSRLVEPGAQRGRVPGFQHSITS